LETSLSKTNSKVV